MIMTTECDNKLSSDDSTTAEAKLTITALDADVEIKRESPPSISLKSVQEKLSRFGSTVKFRQEEAGNSNSEEDQSCQPQDLSVKRRDQGSQTEVDCDKGQRSPRVTIRKVSQKPSEVSPASTQASELEKILRIWLVISRRLAAARLPKVDIAAQISLCQIWEPLWILLWIVLSEVPLRLISRATCSPLL